jgi:hypothetical protein
MPKRKKGRKKGSGKTKTDVGVKYNRNIKADKGIKKGNSEHLEKGMRRSTYY